MEIDSIMQEALEFIKPSKNEIKEIGASLKNIKEKINKNLKMQKIKAEIFVGGSFAKNTIIRKEKYDIDLFLRFDKSSDKKNISEITEKILQGFEFQKVHGSRDYFRIKGGQSLYFEVVPVLKINNPKQSENITDLSYSHVKYINKKIKSEKIKDDIRLAKAFCHANKCYGAESYIKGFSGYGLELLVYYYGGFIKLLRAVSKIKKQEIIDIEKHHKTKRFILMDLNASKLQSPIILIDPTYKQRNALAALDKNTLEKFQCVAKKFLKNPSKDFFKLKNIDFKLLEKKAKKFKLDFCTIEIKTDKQKGDIAGSKLLKFSSHLEKEISKYFNLKNYEFEYFGEDTAKCFFSCKIKKEVIMKGPNLKNVKHAQAFKRKHKNTFIKSGRLYAKNKINFSLKEFLQNWKKNNKRKIEEMSITKIKI